MQRRRLLKLVGASTLGATAAGSAGQRFSVGTTRAAVGSGCSHVDEIPAIEFTKGSSLLDSTKGELTDDTVIALWAERTAYQEDASVTYSEDVRIPLVANDGAVWGSGALLVQEDNGHDGGVRNEYGNEEFVLNVWDRELGGSGTVLWDEGHNNLYALSDVPSFHDYAENNGYTVKATTTLADDLSNADAAVINTPGQSFTASELTALSDFVANGGAVFLHSQTNADKNNEAANLNDIASELSLAYRFNDDDVDDDDSQDYQYNGPGEPAPLTNEFNVRSFDVWADRAGLGLDPGTRYSGTVTSVDDGDTVEVEVDATGREYEIRLLGMDTPETSQNCDYEKEQDWEWVEDESYLCDWGDKASDHANNELDGESVEVELDPVADPWDPFGRLLAYVHWDADDDGSIDTNWCEHVVKEGWARTYDGAATTHKTFWEHEQDAQANGTRVWGNHDGSASEVRDRSVSTVFQPNTSSIRTSGGAIADSRVPVFAESEATQDLDAFDGDTVDYSKIPLVGVDEANNLAMVGGLNVNEEFHSDVSDLEHETFLTNLLDHLKADSRDGQGLIDGGHLQFKEPHSLSNEGCAYYQRYLEGQGLLLEQTNDVTQSGGNALSTGRWLIIANPRTCFTTNEADAVANFISNGGGVLLYGSGWASPRERENLNDLASYLGSDLRLNNDQVVDDTNNVNDDPRLLTTSNLNTTDFSLFGSYS